MNQSQEQRSGTNIRKLATQAHSASLPALAAAGVAFSAGAGAAVQDGAGPLTVSFSYTGSNLNNGYADVSGWDIDGDGQDDFKFQLQSAYTSAYGGYGYASLRLEPLGVANSNGFIQTYTSMGSGPLVKNLANSSLDIAQIASGNFFQPQDYWAFINNLNTYGGLGFQAQYFRSFSAPVIGQGNFGFRFEDSQGQLRYGWAKLLVDGGSGSVNFTISEWHWEAGSSVSAEVLSPDTATVSMGQPYSPAQLEALPPGPNEISEALAAVEFTVTNFAPATFVQVRIPVPGQFPARARPFKLKDGKYVRIPGVRTQYDSETDTTWVTYTIIDNGLLDADPTVGTITDPLVMAIPVAQPVPVGGIGFLGLSLLGMGAAGLRELRRRRQAA